MIDRERVLCAFNLYTSRFNTSELMIENKKAHTIYVAQNCEWIAQKLCLSKEDSDLAWIIGILHDIGRFEQIVQTHCYTDSVINHAEIGETVLFREGLIDSFIDEKKDEIRIAVKYHNKYELPSNLSEKEKMFCNILRDADKIDNFRGFIENEFVSFHERTLESVQCSSISDEIVDCFKRYKTIPHGLIRTDADFFLLPYALIFGIVYNCSFELVKHQDYYRRMLLFKFCNRSNREKFDLIKNYIYSYRKEMNNDS